VLNEMRSSANHIAIVVDEDVLPTSEYGVTAGIGTIEDLIEELVGDIIDEYGIIEQQHATSRGVRSSRGDAPWPSSPTEPA
jgi:putative hemolysin